MKTFLQISFFFLLVTQFCFAQWYWQNPLPTGNALLAVSFADENNGMAVGDLGTIVRTTNGGNDWMMQQSGTAETLYGVCFINVDNGTAVGAHGTILHTSDGGTTWTTQTSGTTFNLYGVTFIDENTGIAVGGYQESGSHSATHGVILRTTNGGITWTSQGGEWPLIFFSISFSDNNLGTIVGGWYYWNGQVFGVGPGCAILRTTNGGANWLDQSGDGYLGADVNWLYSVSFTDANNGTAVGGEEIIRTSDGGTTWTLLPYLTNDLSGVAFSDANNGVVVGASGNLHRTTDGGLNWISQLYTYGSLHSVYFADANNGTAVGGFFNGGYNRIPCEIIHTTNGGTTWTEQSSGITNNLNDVFFTDVSNGFAVGDSGTILKTTNGGHNWLSQSSGSTAVLCGVVFTNTNVGTAVGYDNNDLGVVLRTTNGGQSWSNQLSGTNYQIYGVFFNNENIGTVVGGLGTILRTTDGGQNWINQSIVTDAGLRSVFFIDLDNGWIVGDWGTVVKTTDAGQNWVIQQNAPGPNLTDVCFTDATNGIIVGWIKMNQPPFIVGYIFRTSDGGTNWTEVFNGLFSGLRSVSFTDANHGTAVGAPILRTTDGGQNWVYQTNIVGGGLSGVSFTDANNGWTVGANGTILHTTNGGNPVPVELTSFTATADGKEVTLSWSTATELNNQGFEVQRKFGGNAFVTIGSVKGYGTTTSSNNYTYVDKLVDVGKYFYRLKQIDYDGKYEYSQTLEINWSPFTTYKLEQNFPNPFNPVTTIGFGIPEKGNVRLSVINILGEEIKILLNEEKEAGYHSIDFNGSDLPSGVYFYQLKTGNFIATKKMLLLR